MITPDSPRVSIGLPVYNGEDFLRFAIEAMLAQTFADFELIIVDNASTDSSPAICQAYAAQDQRIRYYRNESNIGGAANVNRTIELSRGEFFKFAAHDDLCSPDFIERCVAVLDRDRSVVLAGSKAALIDQVGQPYQLDEHDLDPLFVTQMQADITVHTDAPTPEERLSELLNHSHYWYPISAVMRMSALRQTPLLSQYAGGDKILLVRLVLMGKFYEIPEPLLLLRRHCKQSLNIGAKSNYLYNIWFSTANKGKLILPTWLRFCDYVAAIRQAPLNRRQRLQCYQVILKLLPYEWKLLLKELIIGSLLILDYLYRSCYRLVRRSPTLPQQDDLLFGKIPRLHYLWPRRPVKRSASQSLEATRHCQSSGSL
jgi:glycosyltransferase involved in cell wall biosynthesis